MTIISFAPRRGPRGSAVDLALAGNWREDYDDPAGGPVVDLGDRAKAWFLVGRGRTGKTFLARWLAERAENLGAQVAIAACDPVNRSLRRFVSGCAEPPSADPAGIKDWLADFLAFVGTERCNAVIDLGGGDTALAALLAETPDLAEVMAGSGVEPVACHVLGSDPSDLAPMGAVEALGFKPRATVLMLNQAHGQPDKFGPILTHPVYRTVLDRGAVRVWMPMMTAAAARQVDDENLHFNDVARKLGPFAQSSVRTWLRRMDEAFAPISSWIPGDGRNNAA
jgi:hypothetical protein